MNVPSSVAGSALLVPVQLDVLAVRAERVIEPNPGFATAGAGPDDFTGTGEQAGSAAAGFGIAHLGAATTTTTQLLPADADQPARLHVTTLAPFAGVVAHLPPPVTNRRASVVTVRLFVESGDVAVYTTSEAGATPHLDAGPVGVAYSNANTWLTIRTLADPGVPESIAVISSPWSQAGAQFWLAELSVRAFDSGNLVGNDDLAVPDPPAAITVTGSDIVQDSPAPGWYVRHEAAGAAASTRVDVVQDPSPTPPPGAAGGAARDVLRCTTNSGGCGIGQQLLARGLGPVGVQAAARILVESGAVTLSCGPDRADATARVDAAAGWQVVSVDAATPAVSVEIWASSSGGATFLVDQVWVQPQPLDQLVTNGDLATPADPSDPTAAINVGPNPNPGQDYSGGASAAAGWGVWNNSGAAVTTTALVQSTRRTLPGSGATMLHVTTSAGSCGIVQVFVQASNSASPRRVSTGAWVYVVSGTVAIGTGNGGDTGADATSATTGSWELITAENGVWPANEVVVYSNGGPAEFYVDAVQIREHAPWNPVAATALADPRQLASGPAALQPAPFTDLPLGRRPGTYLHWALPDALGRAQVAGADATLSFPALPDRWLVCRLSATATPTNQPASRALTAWLLGSDALGEPAVVPVPVTGNPPPDGLAPAPPALTVLGPGDPGWTAYFDNVENRLAFHDPLDDDPAGPLAYLVVGWYTDASHDPLTGGWAASPADLGWAVPGRPGPDVDGTIYHGCAVCIGWPDTTWADDVDGALSNPARQQPEAAALRTIVAGHLVDALTTLLGSAGETDTQRRVLTHFLDGSIGEFGAVDGPATLAAATHAAAFTSAPTPPGAETIWQESSGSDQDEGAPNGEFQTVARSSPRLFTPGDPVLVVQGGGRSFTYGGDGRFTTDGMLTCRMSDQTVTTLGPDADGPAPSDVVAGRPTYPNLPAEAASLLVELAALDPGSAPPATAGAAAAPALVRTRWWLGWDATATGTTLPPLNTQGVLPSPIALTPATVPWTPTHLDWSVRATPVDGTPSAWVLDGPELTAPQAGLDLDPDSAAIVVGRTPLGSSPATLLGAGGEHARTLLADADAGSDIDTGDQPPPELADADIVGGSLRDFRARLRGENVDPVVQQPGTTAASVSASPAGDADSGYLLQLTRARLVDGFGQVLDLPSSTGPDPERDDSAVTAAPRLPASARIVFSYVDADGSGATANDVVSPVCGYVLPDFEGHTLQICAADGASAGRLASVDGATTWQSAPGVTTPLGSGAADSVDNAHLARLVDALVSADRAAVAANTQTALCATLRAIDTTRFTIALLPSGDEHRALLLGCPAVVFRATMTLEVDTGISDELASTPIQVQLGALDRIVDGVLGFYINDDYTRLHVVDPAVASLAVACTDDAAPLTAPYIDSTSVFIRPGQQLDLTLLVEPSALVHITAGVLPQKAIGQRRDWIDSAMQTMTAALAVGPVLVPPVQASMPLPADIHGTWCWAHRSDPYTWQVDPVVPASPTALGDAVLAAQDGWLQLQLAAEQTWDDYGTQVAVDAVALANRDDAGSLVTAVGGTNAETGDWTLTLAEVLVGIETGKYRYVMSRHQGGNPADPVVGDPVALTAATNDLGLPTVAALTADGTNALLELPECGVPIEIWDPALPADQADKNLRYVVQNPDQKLALDVRGGTNAVADGTPVQRATPDTTLTSQQFQFVWIEKSYFQVVAWNSGTCLEVADASSRPGAAVQLAMYTGAANQQWQVVSRDGCLVLLARHSGLCLSGVPDGARTGDAACVQQPYHSAADQQWTVTPISRTAQTTDASILDVHFPSEMYAWQTYGFSLTVRNTSNSVWYPLGLFDLQPTGDLAQLTIGGIGPVTQSGTYEVAPGEWVTFLRTVTANDAQTLHGAFQFQGFPNGRGSSPTVAYGAPSAPITSVVGALPAGVPAVQIAIDPAHLNPADADNTLVAGQPKHVVAQLTNLGTFPLYSTRLELTPIDAYWSRASGSGGDFFVTPLAPGTSGHMFVDIIPGKSGAHTLQLQVSQWPFGAALAVTAPVQVTVCGLAAVLNAAGTPVTAVSVRRGAIVTLSAELTTTFGTRPANDPVVMDVIYPTGPNSATSVPVTLTPNTTHTPSVQIPTSNLPLGANTVTFRLGPDSIPVALTVTKAKDKDKEKEKDKERDKLAIARAERANTVAPPPAPDDDVDAF